MQDIHDRYNALYSNKVIFGGVAGFVGTSIIYPFDTIRTRLQSKKAITISRAALYRGFALNLSYVIPEKAVKFGVNEYLLDRNKNPTTLDRVLYGSLAGAAQSFITAPAEQLKIKLQTNMPFLQALRSINLLKGVPITMARDVPFTAVFFPMYRGIKQYKFVDNTFGNDLIAGLISAAVSTAMVTPIDVVKTRYQLENKPILEVVRNLNVYENPKVLFTGVLPRVLCVGILYSITIASFDVQKRYFIEE